MSLSEVFFLMVTFQILTNVESIQRYSSQVLLPSVMESGGDPDAIVREKKLAQISDPDEIKSMIDEVIEANQSQLQQYLQGKNKLFGFFQGQVRSRKSSCYQT